jgi:hypothetical protein
MSRPKPTILLSHTDSSSFKAEQILDADAIYAVFYNGKPINVRMTDRAGIESAKYKKSSFSNAAHAFNLAERLNKLFKSVKFEVVKLTVGEVIAEDK